MNGPRTMSLLRISVLFQEKVKQTNKNKNIIIAEAVWGDVQVRVHTVLFEGFKFKRRGEFFFFSVK